MVCGLSEPETDPATGARGFTASFKQWDVEALVDHYFFRPVAELLVRAVLPVRAIRPNHLSVASVLAGVAAMLTYWFMPGTGLIVGGIFLSLSVVLDAADGQLARSRRASSEIGKLFDNICDPLKAIPVMFGIVLAMDAWAGWGNFPIPFGWSEHTAIWALGWFAGLSMPLQVMTRNAWVDRYQALGRGKASRSMASVLDVRREYEELRGRPGLWLDKGLAAIFLMFAGAPKPAPEATPPVPGYEDALRPYIRLWTFFGGGQQFAVLAIASFVGQPVWGLLYVAVLGNAAYLLLLALTTVVHRRASATS